MSWGGCRVQRLVTARGAIRSLLCVGLVAGVLLLTSAAANMQSRLKADFGSYLKSPDYSSPLQLNPNSVKDIAAATPLDGVDLIQAPSPNSRGTADLSYRIELPAGRGAFTPSLDLQYSSANGNGVLGVGWQLPVQAITIDTRWGVPAYDGTERYLLRGEELVPMPSQPGDTCTGGTVLGRYALRKESFERVLKCRDDRDGGVRWEVTAKDGTRYDFGLAPNSRLGSYVLPDEGDHVAVWYLSQVTDPNGNVTTFTYLEDASPTGYIGELYIQRYLAQIDYTSHVGPKLSPAYSIRLTYGPSKQKQEYPDPQERPDPIVDGRFGFKTATRLLLEEIAVYLRDPLQTSPTESLIRRYALDYKPGSFGKSLLSAVTRFGENDAVFYTHTFEYQAPQSTDSGEIAAFSPTKTWSVTSTDDGALTSEDRFLTNTSEVSHHITYGVGVSFEFEAGSAIVGCSAGISGGVAWESPKPDLLLRDVNGDGIADRIWRDGNAVRAVLGLGAVDAESGDSVWSFASPDGASTFGVGLSSIGSEDALGGHISWDASCEAGPISTGRGIGLSFRKADTNSLLADADGDGYADMTWGGTYAPGLPRTCRSPGTAGSCPDGLPLCSDEASLCFGKSEPWAAASPEDTWFASPQIAGTSPGYAAGGTESFVAAASELALRPISYYASQQLALDHSALAETPSSVAPTTLATARGGTVSPGVLPASVSSGPATTLFCLGTGSAASVGALATTEPEYTEVVVTSRGVADGAEASPSPKLADDWGPYTALRSRIAVDSVLGDQMINMSPVIRWDATQDGVVEVTASSRRKFDSGKDKDRDGVLVSLLLVTDPTTAAGTRLLGQRHLLGDSTEWWEIPNAGSYQVSVGDSLIVVTDALKDIPIGEDGTMLDETELRFHIEYRQVCPPGQDRRPIRPEELSHKDVTGQLAYVYDYPKDFSISELPREPYWMLLPPLGPPRPNGAGGFDQNRVTGVVKKLATTETPVHVRIRCESMLSQSALDDTTYPLGTILWEHTFAPDEIDEAEIQGPGVDQLRAPWLTNPGGVTTYNPLRLLFEVDGENGSEVPTDSVEWKPQVEIVSIYSLKEVRGPDDELPAVLVRKAVVDDGWPIHTLKGLNDPALRIAVSPYDDAAGSPNAPSELAYANFPRATLMSTFPAQDTVEASAKEDLGMLLAGQYDAIVYKHGALRRALEACPGAELQTLLLLLPGVSSGTLGVLVRGQSDMWISSYQDLNRSDVALAYPQELEPLVVMLFPKVPEAQRMAVASLDEAVSAVMDYTANVAIGPRGSLEAKMQQPAISEKCYTCCPQGTQEDPRGLGTQVLYLKQGEPRYISPAEPWTESPKVLFRVHPSRQLTPLRTVEPNQTLWVHATAVRAAEPLIVTVTGDDFEGDLLRFETPPVEMGATAVLRHLFQVPAGGGYGPDLAVAWEFSSDSRLMTIHTQQGVLGPSGTELTAYDIIALLQPQLASIEGLTSYSALDAYTMRFAFDLPTADLHLASFIYTVNAVDIPTIDMPTTGVFAHTEDRAVVLPTPGLYYVRGYTEASFDPRTSYSLSAELEGCYTLIRDGHALDIPAFATLDNDYTILGFVGSQEVWQRRHQLRNVPEKNVTFYATLQDAARHLPCSPSHELPWLGYIIAPLDGIEEALQETVDGVPVREFVGAGLPTEPLRGPVSVPVNLLHAEFGKGLHLSASQQASQKALEKNLVGEVAHSVEPFGGGHRSFFYGVYNTAQGLSCIGPYACQDGIASLPGATAAGAGSVEKSAAVLVSSRGAPSPVLFTEGLDPGGRAGLGAESWDAWPFTLTPEMLVAAVRAVAQSSPAMEPARRCGPPFNPYDADGAPMGSDPCAKDTDGDGIPDCCDKCPTQPEDFNGVEDSDGCPDWCRGDADGDEVLNCVDKCPYQAGDAAHEGCPPSPAKEPDLPSTDFPPVSGGVGPGGDSFKPDEPGVGITGDGVSPGVRFASAVDGALVRTATLGVSVYANAGVTLWDTLSLGAGADVGLGATFTDHEFMDWNGDGVPDLTSPNVVTLLGKDPRRVTLGLECTASVLGKCIWWPSVRESIYLAAGLSADLGVGKRGSFVLKTTPDGTPKQQSWTTAGVGLFSQVSESWTPVDRLDVNGDGLPDLVYAYMGEDEKIGLAVRLNLGYRLGEMEDWGEIEIESARGRQPQLVGELGSHVYALDAIKDAAGKVSETARAIASARLSTNHSMTTGLGVSFGGGVSLGGLAGASARYSETVSTTLTSASRMLADVNADGLPDIVLKYPREGVMYVRFGLGGPTIGGSTAFSERAALATPSWSDSDGGPRFPKPHSGLLTGAASWIADAVAESPDSLSVSGSSMKSYGGTVSATGLFVKSTYSYTYTSGHSFSEMEFRDVNGDRLPDRVLRNGEEDNGGVQVQANELGSANLLSVVHRPLGGRIDIKYEQRIPSEEDPTARWVMSSYTVSNDYKGDGTGYPSAFATNEISEDVSYEAPFYDRYEREFLGFAVVTSTRPDNRILKTTYENRDYWESGLARTEQIIDGVSKCVLQATEAEYSNLPAQTGNSMCATCLASLRSPLRMLDTPELRDQGRTPCDSRVVQLKRLSVTWQEVGSTASKTWVQEFQEYDGYGNPTRIVDRQDEGENDDIGAVLTYDHNAPPGSVTAHQKEMIKNYIVDRVSRVEVRALNQTPDLLRLREATYDDRGNMTQYSVHNAPPGSNGPGPRVLYLKHDAAGFMEWVRDGLGYVIAYTPDALHMYPSEAIDSFELKATTEYDYRYQRPTKQTDVNRQTMATKYDEFGRVKDVWGPYELAAALKPSCTEAWTPDCLSQDFASVQVDYEDLCNPAQWPSVAVSTSRAVEPGTADVVNEIRTATIVDGLGRTIQTQVDSEVKGIEGLVVSGPVRFDEAGRLVLQGQPVFVAQASTTPITRQVVKEVYPTTWLYDVLDRPTQKTEPWTEPGGRTTVYDYSIRANPASTAVLSRVTETTDPLGHVRLDYTDAAGRLIAVALDHNGAPLVTKYQYTPVGDLLAIVDANGNTQTMSYDLGGHRTSIETPDTGLTEFAYDANGNLKVQTDSVLREAGKSVAFLYDLNRLTGVNYPTTPATTFTYGSPDTPSDLPSSWGRIASVADADGTESRSYGALGEMIASTRVTDGGQTGGGKISFTTQYKYDSFGRLLSMTYPDGEVLTYTYDGGGRVNSAVGERGTTLWRYATDVLYDQFGHTTGMVYGNGVTTSRTYYPETIWLYTEVVKGFVNGAAATLRDMKYTYDAIGDIESVSEERTGHERFLQRMVTTYTYDDLSRLQSSSMVAQSAEGDKTTTVSSYTYDSAGNLLTNKVRQGDATAYPTRNWTYNYPAVGTGRPELPSTIGPYSYTYNARGSIESCVRSPDSDAPLGVRYTWDDAGRLAGAARQLEGIGADVSWSVIGTNYTYSSDGQRVRKETSDGGGGPSSLLWTSVYPNEYYTASFGAAPNPECGEPCWERTESRTKSIYVNGVRIAAVASEVNAVQPGASTLEKNLSYRTEVVRFVNANQVSSTMFLTDQDGALSQEIDYLPYGEQLYDKHSPGDPGLPQEMQFDGKESDPETGLSYFGARYYDPRIARWISADPLVLASPENLSKRIEEINLFAFSGNNPVKSMDPLGLLTVHIWDRRTGESTAGHASITLEDGTYISWSPKTGPPIGLSYEGPAFPHLTFKEDVLLEYGRLPDRNIQIMTLNEQDIKTAWTVFRTTNHTWQTLSQNCATVAVQMLRAGGGFDPADYLGILGRLPVSTPQIVEAYARALQAIELPGAFKAAAERAIENLNKSLEQNLSKEDW